MAATRHLQLPAGPRPAGSWLSRLNGLLKVALVVLIAVCVVVYFRRPLHEQAVYARKIEELRTQHDQIKRQYEAQLRRQHWIQHDPEYLELELRDRLNLQKEDEFILRFED